MFHLLAAIFSSGFHHFDEHFQIYEFLNLKLGQTTAADLPWEYRERIRPWFQPYLYLYIYKAFHMLGVSSPFVMAFIFRLLTSLFGLYALVRFWGVIKIWFEKERDQIFAWALLNLCWFVPYIQTRTSSESLSISFYLIGLSFFLKSKTFKSSFWAGVCFGACYLARSQMALPVAFIWFWALLIEKRGVKSLAGTAFSIVIMNILGVLIDSIGYGSFTISIWHYYRTNFAQGIMSSVKQYPFYWYFYWLINRGIPPVSLVLTFAGVWGWIKYYRHPLTWATLPLFIFHSLVGHKELRYIFPVIILSPLYLTLLYHDYRAKVDHYLKKGWVKFFMRFTVAINVIILVASCLRPANPSVKFYQYLYGRHDISEIYAHHASPFKMLGLKIKFYKREGLVVKEFKELSEIPQDKGHYLFFSRGHNIIEMEKRQDCRLEYMTYPRFALNYNIGNWLSRSRVWSLFYCEASSS